MTGATGGYVSKPLTIIAVVGFVISGFGAFFSVLYGNDPTPSSKVLKNESSPTT